MTKEHSSITREYRGHITICNVLPEIERELSDYDFDAEIYPNYMTMLFFEPTVIVEFCKIFIVKFFSVKVEFCIFDKNNDYEIVPGLEETDEYYGLIVRQL